MNLPQLSHLVDMFELCSLYLHKRSIPLPSLCFRACKRVLPRMPGEFLKLLSSVSATYCDTSTCYPPTHRTMLTLTTSMNTYLGAPISRSSRTRHGASRQRLIYLSSRISPLRARVSAPPARLLIHLVNRVTFATLIGCNRACRLSPHPTSPHARGLK